MLYNVGLAVIVVRWMDDEDKVLLGLRTSKRNNGVWALPGGRLESNELLWECAYREVKEETGLTIDGLTPLGYSLDTFSELEENWITLYAGTRYEGNENPEVIEPDKCSEWRWFSVHDLIKFKEPIWNGTLSQIFKVIGF